MKPPRAPGASKLPLACALVGILAPSVASAVDPYAPAGELDVQRTFVRNGAKVVVSWDITYPSNLDDLIIISPGGTFRTTQDLDIMVNAIGMEYQTVKSNNGHGNNADGVDVSNPGRGGGGPNGEIDRSGSYDDENKRNGNGKERTVELDATLWIAESGTWTELFQGGVSDLGGDQLYHSSSLPMGTTVDLAAQGKSRSGSNEVISTTSPSPNLVVLKDGDPLPSNVGAFQADAIASFLTPYVKDRKIELGPLQMIYLFDLDAAPGSPSYTLQDLGVLVSLKPNGKRTQSVTGPEISQSNRKRLPRGPRGHEGGGQDQPRGNEQPRGNDNPGANSNAGHSNAPGGGTPAAGRTKNQSSATQSDHESGALTLRQLVYRVDVNAVLEELGITLQELEAILRDPDGSKRAELLRTIQEMGLFSKGTKTPDAALDDEAPGYRAEGEE